MLNFLSITLKLSKFLFLLIPLNSTTYISLVFADDNYILRIADDASGLANEIKMAAGSVLNWLRKSGLDVNLKKTELTYFHKKSHLAARDIMIGNTRTQAQDQMRVLGIVFDSKLSWSNHVDKIILDSKRATYGLRRLAKFIPQHRMMEIATAHVYSKLYYGATVWLNESLSKPHWLRLLSASANIIKSSLGLFYWNISFRVLHEVASRATPRMLSTSLKSIALYELLREGNPPAIARDVNDKISIHSRSDKFHIPDTSRTKIGKNSLSNRLQDVCELVNVEDFELERVPFKMKMKRKFLS